MAGRKSFTLSQLTFQIWAKTAVVAATVLGFIPLSSSIALAVPPPPANIMVCSDGCLRQARDYSGINHALVYNMCYACTCLDQSTPSGDSQCTHATVDYITYFQSGTSSGMKTDTSFGNELAQ